jgi:glutathione S-transferase
MTAPTPILWHFPVSHFSEKVRWALDWKRIPHRRKALFADYVPRAFFRTGQLRLPILIVGGRAIADSTRIIAALEERRPEPPLYPPDGSARERALRLEEYFDEELGHPLRTVVIGDLWDRDPERAIELLATGNPDAQVGLAKAMTRVMRAFYRKRHGIDAGTQATARAEVEAALDRLEAEIGASGFLVGDSFSVADLTAAALLGPLVRPPELEYPFPEALLPPYVEEYRQSLAGRRSFAWVREMYRRHRGASSEARG